MSPVKNLSSLDIPPRGYMLIFMNNKQKLIRRLKLIEGQIRGLQKMIANDAYCIDIITQTSAVKQGLSNLEDLLLESHLSSCILRQVKSGETNKAKSEILKVYKLKRK